MTTRIGMRLTDPHGVVDAARLNRLDDRISSCMTRMFRLPENGGNPFLFALSAPKPHEVVPPEFFGISKGMTNPDGSPMRGTAATDGKKYYWDPDFLESLDDDELPVVMSHESYHVIFYHCDRLRAANRRVANWAFDYVVNACIEVDHVAVKRKGKLWGGSLGKPIPLKELLDHIDGKIEADFSEPRIFADVSLHGRSPESIYNDIMSHMDKSPRKCPTCGAMNMDPKTGKPKKPGPCQNRGPQCDHGGMCCPTCGSPIEAGSGQGYGDGMPSPLDAHVDAKSSKQDVMADTMRAAQQAATMRGTVPGDVTDLLGELMKPTLKFTDIVRSACMKKVQDAGLKNDWKRFRRRWISGGRGRLPQYLPKRHTHRPRWVAFLDTSGSMSQDDLTYCISQLQALGNGTEGLIIPLDSSVKWDSAISVRDVQDIQKTKVVGRGGTEFTEAFRDYRDRIGNEWDAMIVLTDGDCGTYSKELRPSCDLVWVLSRNNTSFSPGFGRVAPLRNERL